MTTKYTVSMTAGDYEVTPDIFAAAVAPRLPGLRREGRVWNYGTALTLVPGPGQGFELTSDLNDLFDFLSAFFAVPSGTLLGITFVQPETSDTVVVVHNDTTMDAATVEVAITRFAEAESVLIAYDIFRVTFPALFREIDDGTDPDSDFPSVTLAPQTGFLLAGFAAVTPDNETQSIFVLTKPAGPAVQLLQDIAGVAEAEEYDEDHYHYRDEASGLMAEALDFTSDHGPVIEMRFTHAQVDADRVTVLLAERLASRPETAHLVVEEDFETFELRVRPVQKDGTLGPAKTITYDL